MPFDQLDEVDNVKNDQQVPQNGSLWHATKKTSNERSESATTYILCLTDEIWPKPPMSSAVEAESLLLQTLQRDINFHGVEGCRQIEQNQSTQISSIDGL